MDKAKRPFVSLVYVAMIVLFGGCATPQREVSRPVLKPSPSPPPQPEKLEELVVPLMEERKESERLLSFSLRDADIREALLALSKTIGYNIVLDPDVSGKATVEVNRVTPMEALEALLTPLGLQYKIEDHFIRISKLRRETRVFPLNYITTKRTGSSTFSSNIALGGGGTAGVGTISSTESSDLWEDVEKGLKGLISEGGKVTINKMAGLIVVTDYPSNLQKVAEFLESVEGSVQRQVMIQAKVVDVILSDEYQMGLNWSAITKISGLNLKGTLSGGKILAQSLSPGVGVFQMALSDADFSILLDAMSKQGKVNILSSPKISVLNNQKAAIKVVRSEVFFDVSTRVDPDTKEKTTEATSKTVDVGVVLEVTPQISHDGQVIMNIHPVITEKVGESTFQSTDVKLTAPVLTVRETNTVVKVKDGQTMVIAGLIQEKKNETKTKVPVLGDVPVFGSLFRKTERTGEKSELVIFLTPTVLTGKRIEDLSKEERKRFNLED
jgi:MSHA type pilus biogenesis protein MshL